MTGLGLRVPRVARELSAPLATPCPLAAAATGKRATVSGRRDGGVPGPFHAAATAAVNRKAKKIHEGSPPASPPSRLADSACSPGCRRQCPFLDQAKGSDCEAKRIRRPRWAGRALPSAPETPRLPRSQAPGTRVTAPRLLVASWRLQRHSARPELHQASV